MVGLLPLKVVAHNQFNCTVTLPRLMFLYQRCVTSSCIHYFMIMFGVCFVTVLIPTKSIVTVRVVGVVSFDRKYVPVVSGPTNHKVTGPNVLVFQR